MCDLFTHERREVADPVGHERDTVETQCRRMTELRRKRVAVRGPRVLELAVCCLRGVSQLPRHGHGMTPEPDRKRHALRRPSERAPDGLGYELARRLVELGRDLAVERGARGRRVVTLQPGRLLAEAS